MGLAGKFSWMSTNSKKQCRSLFWRMRAAVKKAVKTGGKSHRDFQYDPSSYALNFDDGGGKEANGNGLRHCRNLEDYVPSGGNNTTWIYALRVKSSN
ncbi:hypothetical protein Nepgr_007256 [Nepenthes gracilis]|uniref:Uncharacterized protein n=1 Tax=Nepenthes gracilis TaxID=150966 RepID=A0AAD3XIB8_NEPGR|nr:hypothetical protein Nepgr_007256 [Nepenthes gracilis]